MTDFCRTFYNDEAGAVSVDWVVLTAAIVLLGLAVGSKVGLGAQELGNDVAGDMNAMVTS